MHWNTISLAFTIPCPKNCNAHNIIHLKHYNALVNPINLTLIHYKKILKTAHCSWPWCNTNVAVILLVAYRTTTCVKKDKYNASDVHMAAILSPILTTSMVLDPPIDHKERTIIIPAVVIKMSSYSSIS